MSLGKLKHSIRDKTRRTHGQRSQAIIVDLNRTLRGRFEYFKHSHRFTFTALDEWVRMQSAKPLNHRQGRKGQERGTELHGAALSGDQKVAVLAVLSWVAIPVKNATLSLSSP